MSGRRGFVLLVVLACVAVPAGPASAEWFADLYAGVAFTDSRTIDDVEPAALFRLKDVDFDKSATFGGRVGYWFDAMPYFGLGIDAFHYEANVSKQRIIECDSPTPCGPDTLVPRDITVTAVSFDLMGRWPLLKSSEFPMGRLQPYATVGPTVFHSRLKDTTHFVPPNQSETDTTFGVKVGAGVTWLLLRNLALFGEYRFTHFGPTWNNITDGTTWANVETMLNSHHLIFGLSFRFP